MPDSNANNMDASKDTAALRQLFSMPDAELPSVAAAQAASDFPGSLLFSAFAAFIGLNLTPDQILPSLFAQTLSKHMGKNCEGLLYGDLDPVDIRALYSRALLAKIKEGDAERVIVAEELIKMLDQYEKSLQPKGIAQTGIIASGEGMAPMGRAELQKVINSLPQDVFVVALYINERRGYQDDWLSELALALREKNFVSIGILTPKSAPGQRLRNVDYLAIIPKGEICGLKGIHVFVLSDSDCHNMFPSSSVKMQGGWPRPDFGTCSPPSPAIFNQL